MNENTNNDNIDNAVVYGTHLYSETYKKKNIIDSPFFNYFFFTIDSTLSQKKYYGI